MERTDYRFYVSYPPHILSRRSVATIIHSYLIALIPAALAGLYYFHLEAVQVILFATVTALLCDFAMQKFLKQPVTVTDGSAVLSGVVLAFLLPPTTPWWVVVVGAVVAVVLGKQLFGGLGNHPFHSSLVGWIVLRISWPDKVTGWIEPYGGNLPYPPLEVLKVDGVDAFRDLFFGYGDLFLGQQAGGIGSICMAALLAGGLYLLAMRVITWHIPVGVLGTVAGFSGILWLLDSGSHVNPLYHLLCGTVFLGAFFIATDPVTSPLTRPGKLAYGVICGLLIIVIRQWGKYPDGVAFAILLANACTPLLNKITPRPYGKEEPSA